MSDMIVDRPATAGRQPTTQGSTLNPWRRRFLHRPLLQKILLVNSAVVVIGAVVGTIVTVWHVQRYPTDVHYGLIAIFATAGVVISVVVNSMVLRWALAPLDRLQTTVDAVRAGDTDVRVQLGANSDERFDRLADTFNRMLDEQAASARRTRQLSRQILQAQEDERQRVARELHDEAAQALTSLLVHLRLLERAQTPEEAQGRVQDLRVLTAAALEEVRRVALDLRPTILDDLGLAPALEWRVETINQNEGVNARFSASGLDRRVPREQELVFYRIGQEALSNVVKYAGPCSVSVTLTRRDGELRLAVTDDGRGFDPAAVRTNGKHCLGLVGMRERIAMVGGTVDIRAGIGEGTEIVATAPVPELASADQMTGSRA